jgi:hypothetical protein
MISLPKIRVYRGQKWERRSVSGTPWRPVEVVNVLGNVAELRFLDMPDAHDLQRVFSTNMDRMLSSVRQSAEYRLVQNA